LYSLLTWEPHPYPQIKSCFFPSQKNKKKQKTKNKKQKRINMFIVFLFIFPEKSFEMKFFLLGTFATLIRP